MKAVVAGSLVLAVATIAFGAAYPVFLSTSTPTGDIIDFYHQFLEAGGFTGYGFSQLYQWHNEHRLVVPKLWFLADVALVDARQTVLLTVIFVSGLVHAALLAALFRGLGHPRRAVAVAFLIAAAAMASPVQYENLLQGFQVQFIQVWLFATLAFALVAWAPARDERPVLLGMSVVGALIAALGSTYSMFNGLAVWPLLIVFAFWRRLPIAWSLVVAAVGCAVMAIEVTAFMHRPGGGGGLTAEAGVGTILRFVARYLTSSIGEIGTLGQELVGLTAIACIVAGGVYGLLRPARTSATRMALFAVCAFVLAAALATALGRLHLGLGAANSSRYTTPSIVFLVTAGLLGFDVLLRLQRQRVVSLALAVSTLLLLVPGDVHGVRGLRDRLAARDLSNLTIVSHLAGGYRPDMLRHIYPHWPPRPQSVLDAMQAAGLGPFSELERFQPPEAALAEGPAVVAPLCDGSADRLQIDPVTGVTFAAWLIKADSGVSPLWVVARSLEGRVVAWGAGLEPRMDRVPVPDPGFLSRGFQAFGEAPEPPVDVVTVEGVFADGSRCRLPGTVAAGPDRYLKDLPAASRPANSGAWSFEGHALSGGVGAADVPVGAAPVFGSFGLADRRFAASVALGDPGSARGILVPIHTERWPFGTTLKLLDADGGTLDEIELKRPVAPTWSWAVLRPAAVSPGMRLVIRTVQRHGFNDVAFGTPHWLP
ncbi:MAG: hypothetical protein P1U88_09155 [Thalassobaculaceae bacterium]|nr:hypothetical protein [Thalassobaculaceae bacterium]